MLSALSMPSTLSLHDALPILDWLEELWVEKIAVWSWRLRRLIRCESGQISKALADHGYEIQQSKAADSENLGIAPPSNPEIDARSEERRVGKEGKTHRTHNIE